MKTLSQLFWLDHHAGTVGGRRRLVRELIALWQRAENGSTERFSIGDESVSRQTMIPLTWAKTISKQAAGIKLSAVDRAGPIKPLRAAGR